MTIMTSNMIVKGGGRHRFCRHSWSRCRQPEASFREKNILGDLDKAPRLSISIVIWILSSDTICQLNQFNTNSEAAILST